MSQFIKQVATSNILLKVTNVCSLCYDDIIEGDFIYYDTQKYHYICQRCKDSESLLASKKDKTIDEIEDTLFC